MPANPPSPDKGGRELSRPRHADRSARARVALRKSAIRTVATATLLAALHWGIPYLRHQPELSVPAHSTIDGLLAVCRAGLAIFLLTELSLLTGAVLTIRAPELHLRFLNLMLFWSYVLVAPYLLIEPAPASALLAHRRRGGATSADTAAGPSRRPGGGNRAAVPGNLPGRAAVSDAGGGQPRGLSPGRRGNAPGQGHQRGLSQSPSAAAPAHPDSPAGPRAA